MSNILVISVNFPPEPVVSAFLSYDLANELSKSHNIVVLCPPPTRPLGFSFVKLPVFSNYCVERIDSYTSPKPSIYSRIRESYSFGNHCKHYINNNYKHIDCIYVDAWPLFAQYIIVHEAKKLKIPCVLHIQDIYPESLAIKLPSPLNKLLYKIIKPFDASILRASTKIIGNSPSMISYLSADRMIDNNKFELVRNWQDDTNYKDEISSIITESQFIFMYVGSISPTAGVEGIINSFHEAKLKNAKLIIAGNGSNKERCIEISKKLDCNIEFCEVMPNNVPDLQSKANVLILPLKKGISITATPSKLTAYMLSAKPIIACVEEESDVAKIIHEANCGFIVQPENIEDLSTALINISQKEIIVLHELGLNGRKFAKNNFTKELNLQKLVSTITGLLKTEKNVSQNY